MADKKPKTENHQDFPSMKAAGLVEMTRGGVTKTMAEWAKEHAEDEKLDAAQIAEEQAEVAAQKKAQLKKAHN